MNTFFEWLRSKVPVSRGRYNRELSLLRLSVNRSIEEEKRQLNALIGRITNSFVMSNDHRRVGVTVDLSSDLHLSMRDPYLRRRLILGISEQVAKTLEAEMTNAYAAHDLYHDA